MHSNMARIEVIAFIVCVFIFINGVLGAADPSTGNTSTAKATVDNKNGEVLENEETGIKIEEDSKITKLARMTTMARSPSELSILKKALDEIDLTTYPPQSVTYYKNALLLYTRILDTHFFTERPSYSSLKNLEKFSEIGGEETDLLSIGATVISEYDKSIVTKDDYLMKATYYRAVKWVQTQTDEKNPILKTTLSILTNSSKKRKARNYLLELLHYDKRASWFNWSDDKLKTLEGWKKPNENDEALKFCEQIAVSRGANALEVDAPVTDLNVYDRILTDANERVFKLIFNVFPYEMSQILDYAFHLKYKAHQIQEDSVYRQATQENEIDLKTITNDMKRYKYASILFAAAFRQTYELNFITERTNEELATFPELKTKIRYRSFIQLACNLPREMNAIIQTMDEVGGLFSFSNKAYLYWLVQWYQRIVYSYEYEEYNDLNICLESLLESTKTTHILNELYNSNYVNTLIYKEAATTATLSQLLELGKHVNNALSTIMAFTLDELIDNYKETKTLWYDLKSKNKPTVDNEITLKTYKKAIQGILKFGLPETRVIKRNVYDSLMANINSDEFEHMFLIPLSTIKERIAMKLKSETSERRLVQRWGSLGR